MGTEIERKFLVKNDAWRAAVASRGVLRQGYLAAGGTATVRVRLEGDRAWLNVKGPTRGIERAEFEYEIPAADAESLLTMCGGAVVEKTRHRVPVGGKVWEVDEFSGSNAGLVVAEIELDSANEDFPRPAWLDVEVSGDKRFLNANLSREPVSTWEPDWRARIVLPSDLCPNQ